MIKEKLTDKISLFNCDCMEFIKNIPDKYYDLAIVDPPYGIGEDWLKRNKGHKFGKTTYKNNSIPSKEYFCQLFRISKNQIIWGYNYYCNILGPTNYLIVWDKESNDNQVFKYSKCEIAYTSFRVPCNIVHSPWDGYRMGKETGERKIHPHQKPVQLYEWLLQHYAKPTDKIIDTHFGSCSIGIACHNFWCPLDACEIDKEYFDKAVKRLKENFRQLSIF